MDLIPFKKDQFLPLLNQLLEKDVIRVKKINKDYKLLLLTPVESAPPPPKPLPDQFKEAYSELERGRSYVRICDLRRHLGLTVQEFDKTLTDLRDTGKIRLQDGSTGFTEEDVREGFIDENGFRSLIVIWRQ
jgi:predicted Rossmann fold nucleotide-binding protein DprA/Smf involved in DNA uptake